MKRSILALCAAVGLLSGCASLTDNTLVHKGETVRTVFFNLKYPVGSPEANKVLRYAQENLTQIPGVADFQILKQVDAESGYQYRMTVLFPDKASYEFFKGHVIRKRVFEELHKHQTVYNVYDSVTFDFSDSASKK